MSHPGRRISREQRTIAAMLAIYCRERQHHAIGSGLCAECRSLLEYAQRRLDSCPFQENKPVCNQCTVHCYSQAMQRRVREVMRYAGPRMLRRHPLLGVRHLLDQLRPAPKLPPRR